MARADTARQMWFLNGRTLRDRVLARILREGYRGFLPDGRQPVVFLNLHLDPARVDVNVHPTKAEVRFRDQQRIFGFLANAIREAVRRRTWRRRGTDVAGAGRRPARRVRSGSLTSSAAPRLVRGARSEGPERRLVRDADSVSIIRPAERGCSSCRGRWCVSETTCAVLSRWRALHRARGARRLRDHRPARAARTLTYELLLRDARGPARAASPRPRARRASRAEVEVPPSACLPRKSGRARVPGDDHRRPAHRQGCRARPQGLVRDLCELLARTGRAPRVEEVLEEVLHSAACRSSVMAGDELAEEEIRALLGRARELDSDQTCPHARPTRVRFTLADLEKAFHRRWRSLAPGRLGGPFRRLEVLSRCSAPSLLWISLSCSVLPGRAQTSSPLPLLFFPFLCPSWLDSVLARRHEQEQMEPRGHRGYREGKNRGS